MHRAFTSIQKRATALPKIRSKATSYQSRSKQLRKTEFVFFRPSRNSYCKPKWWIALMCVLEMVTCTNSASDNHNLVNTCQRMECVCDKSPTGLPMCTLGDDLKICTKCWHDLESLLERDHASEKRKHCKDCKAPLPNRNETDMNPRCEECANFLSDYLNSLENENIKSDDVESRASTSPASQNEFYETEYMYYNGAWACTGSCDTAHTDRSQFTDYSEGQENGSGPSTGSSTGRKRSESRPVPPKPISRERSNSVRSRPLERITIRRARTNEPSKIMRSNKDRRFSRKMQKILKDYTELLESTF